MMNEPISSIMSTNLITVSKEDTLETVADIFRARRIHHLPVVEDGMLVGLVTTFDLFKLGKDKSEYSSVKVADIMTSKLATLEPNAKVGTACEIFLENLFHALPVAENGKLMGIVTSFDVLKYMHMKEYPNQEIMSSMVKK
jgi:acetoin utilization protein AcuB